MSTLRSLKAAGKIILIVHHDLSKVVDYFDRVILLNRKLIAFGPTETSFTKDNMKKDLRLPALYEWRCLG